MYVVRLMIAFYFGWPTAGVETIENCMYIYAGLEGADSLIVRSRLIVPINYCEPNINCYRG